MKNFFGNRLFRARIGDTMKVQRSRVTQGSVLSCTLIALAVEEMVRTINHDIKHKIYVGYFTIHASSVYIPPLERQTQIGN